MTNTDSFSGKGHFMLQQLLRASIAGCTASGRSPRAAPRIAAGRSADVLESINARRARGESFASIAAALNKEGFSGAYGGRWYASSVWAYLQRRSQA